MEAPSKSKKSSRDKKLKKSGVRTKFLIESLRNDYYALREENDKLRNMVTSNLPDEAASEILSQCFDLSSANKAKADNIDDLANKMGGAGMDDDDDEY